MTETMNAKELNAYWTRTFPECPPVGFLLRHVYADRCARFCGLPDGNQNPETDDEFAEFCRRQTALMSEIYRDEPRIVLITTSYSRDERPVRDSAALNRVDPDYQYLQSIGMHELALEFDTSTYWHLFMSTWPKQADGWHAVLRLAGTKSLFGGALNVILLGPISGRIMYVHGCGMDIIAKSREEREQLRQSHAAWAHDTPEGS